MHVLFEDREEAGRRIAKRLGQYRQSDAIIMAIPRGGVPVAAAAAQRLQLPWSFVVTRKLPVPSNPEAGFGAVAADGSTVLNKAMLAGLRLTKERIEAIIQHVREDVAKRAEMYLHTRRPIDVAGRPVIVVDDGVASGYTMLAAIESLRGRHPSKIIASSPVASRSAAALIKQAADECIFEIISPAVPFAVADFYVVWHDLTDDDILPLLERLEVKI